MIKLIRKAAAKYLLSQQNKPQQLSDLKYAFVDSEGMRYYQWEQLSEIPVCRHSELMQMVGYSDAKISPESLANLCDEIDKRNHGLITEKVAGNKQKLHAQMFALTNEIRDRSSFSVPKTIMVRMAAALICREDEDPNKFNAQQNEEKVIQFTKDLNNGNAFFLKSSLMKQLYNSLLGTRELFAELLQNWELDQRRELERLKIILQRENSKSEEQMKSS